MSKHRKQYRASFKAKVALEALKGQDTIHEIASRYGLHPNLITNWKKLALAQLSESFSDQRSRAAYDEQALKAQFYQQIGQLKVELDWLKKSWAAQLMISGR
jgi:putative transposase